MPIPQASNPVGSVKNISQILSVIKVNRGATLSEIESQIDLSLSSIHNYLATLREEEFIIKKDNTYHLSLLFLDFSTIARNRYEILEAAREEIDELASETGEMVNLLVEEYGRGIHIYRQGGQKALEYSEYTGYHGYLHNSAAGKCILAYKDPDRVEEILEHHGTEQTARNTITDLDKLSSELNKIRGSEVAFDDEESLDGCRCVAAPVMNKSNQEVVGAVSISGPKRRMKGDRYNEELPEMIRDTTNVIEVKLSYNSSS